MDASKGFFLVLVSLVLHLANGDVQTIDLLDESDRTPLTIETTAGTIVSCKLTRPNATIVDPNVQIPEDFDFKLPCMFTPKKTWNMNSCGTYSLTLTYKEGEEQKQTSRTYILNWIYKVTPISAKIFNKQILTVHMLSPSEDFPKFKSCEYKKNEIENVQEEGKEEENQEEAKPGEEKPNEQKPSTFEDTKESTGTITENGLCQVTMSDTDAAKHNGIWDVISTTERGQRLKGSFEVSVLDDKILDDFKEKSLTISAISNVINVDIAEVDVEHCSLYDNSNVLVVNSFGPCSYKIEEVSKHYEGEWKAKLLLQGRVDAFEQTLKVTVFVQGKQTQCENVKDTKKVNLICECKSSTQKKCLFSGPSGQVISLTEGVGNSKYSFYSNFKEISGIQHCGLTINARDKKDEGTWKCQVENDCHHFIQISEQNGCIEPDQNTEYTPTAPETFYALQNKEALGLTCSINSDLQFCFFRTNIGEEVAGYTVDNSPGLCVMPQFSYTTNHTGKWACILGVPTQTREYTKDINVQVISSWFQPAKEEFVYDKTTGVEIKCLNHDPADSEVLLCRFIRPDGFIIKLDGGAKSDHYLSTSQPIHGVCGLKLEGFKNEDKGNWKCSAIAVSNNERVIYSNNFLVSSASLFNISLQLVALVSISLTWYTL